MRIAALLCLAGLVAVGCGPGDDLVERRPVVADVGESLRPSLTPAQTAYDWWETLRARDPEAALSRLTPAARRTVDLDRLTKALDESLGRFTEASEAHVLYTERGRGRTTVFMRIDGGGLVGSRLVKGGSIYLALPLVRRDGVWLIESAAWIRAQTDQYLGFEKLKRENQDREAPEEGEDGE